MKASEVTILILPGVGGGTDGHWYARWHAGLKTARRIEHDDWSAPDRARYTAAIADAVAAADKPVVLIGHALGTLAAVHAVPAMPAGKVLGAFLAALPDVAGPGSVLPAADTFLPLPRDPLPFPSLLLASRTDPHCDFAVAEDLAAAWGARLVDLRESGHVDVDSGHGPWPEGLMTFGKFLGQLRAD